MRAVFEGFEAQVDRNWRAKGAWILGAPMLATA